MRHTIRSALAALRGFLAGYLGMSDPRLGVERKPEGTWDTSRVRHALEERSARRGNCC